MRASALPEKITRGSALCAGLANNCGGGGGAHLPGPARNKNLLWRSLLLWRLDVCMCVSLAGMRELVLCLRRARCYYTPRAAAAEDVQIFVSQQIGTGFHALNFKAGRRLLDIIWPN